MKDKASSARSPSRHRRRRRSRSRRRDKKKERGKASPEVKPKKEEIPAADPDVGDEFEALEEEEEEDPEAGSQDDEVEKHPEKFELRQIAKPSPRKPLPRRPRSPSVSPPGYRSRDPAPIKRWKGWQHVYRGQERQAKGKGKGGKGRPSKGKSWRRK